MHNGHFRRMTTIAGVMLCLIAAAGDAQDTSVTTPPTTGPATTGTAGGPPFDTTMMAAPIGMADTVATAERDDFDFPWGLLGLLGLLGFLKRDKGTTVVTRENYASPPSGTRPGRPTGADDRTMNLNPRPGEGTDPGARR